MLHNNRSGVPPFELHHPQGHKTREFSHRWKRISPNHRFRNRQNLLVKQLQEHKWDTGLHGSRGNQQTKPFFLCGFLCGRGHRLRVHAWESITFFIQRPYKGYSRQEIKDQIMLFEASVKKTQIPPGWDLEAADFINRMLKRKQEERLGYHGID